MLIKEQSRTSWGMNQLHAYTEKKDNNFVSILKAQSFLQIY